VGAKHLQRGGTYGFEPALARQPVQQGWPETDRQNPQRQQIQQAQRPQSPLVEQHVELHVTPERRLSVQAFMPPMQAVQRDHHRQHDRPVRKLQT